MRLCFMVALLLCVSCGILRAEPVVSQLAKDGGALLKITIAGNASRETRAVADEFAGYLSQISGAQFAVETGDGASGIVLGLPEDFPSLPFEVAFGKSAYDREKYLLRSTDTGLYLLGASDMAVSNAVWDVLHRLGYRQFFPGDTWEIVPEIADLHIAIDEFQEPSFYARRIWYNWGLWEYNDIPYRDWCRRNRARQGFYLDIGHSYDSIIRVYREEFDNHPEYFALIDGKRSTNRDDQKFCISNPGLQAVVVDYAVSAFKRNPRLDSVSLDPSDGYGWCECEECAKIGKPSNRVVLLAQKALEALEEIGLGEKVIGFLAYNQHGTPPDNIRVPQGAIPCVTTAFQSGELTFDQLIAGWQAQGAEQIGVYDYLSVVVWDWNMPRSMSASNPEGLARFLPHIHEKGARFYDAESGDCWGPAGLGYYFAARVLWDVGEAEKLADITEDFLDKSFGPAAEPMREFYRLLNFDHQQKRPLSDMVGRLYRQIAAARQLTADPKILRRLDDLTLYVRHAELYGIYTMGKAPKDDVTRHVYRMRETMMVHSYGFLCQFIGVGATRDPANPLFNNTPYSAEEIAAFLAQGIANNMPIDSGFDGVAFSKNLVPAAARLNFPETPPGYIPTESMEHQEYYVYLPEGGGNVDFKITVQPLWKGRPPKISLYSPLEVRPEVPVDEAGGYPIDGQPYDVLLKSPFGGLHTVIVMNGGDYARVAWPEGFLVTAESDSDSAHVQTHFRGNWTLYCYVPKGTRQIGGWAQRTANWAPRNRGKILDPEGNARFDFGEMEGDAGWFLVDVPEGMDGKLWKFEDNNGMRFLMTVPPYLARSGAELLLPEEVIEKDAE